MSESIQAIVKNVPIFKQSTIINGFLFTSKSAVDSKNIKILQIQRSPASPIKTYEEEYEIGRLIKDTRYGHIHVGYLLSRLPQDNAYTRSVNIPPVAVKVYTKSQLSLFAQQNELKQPYQSQQHSPYDELYNLQTISPHPFLIQLIHITQDISDGCIYFFMDYCSEGDIYDVVIQNGPIVENVAKLYFKQMVQCIQHIHNQGLSITFHPTCFLYI